MLFYLETLGDSHIERGRGQLDVGSGLNRKAVAREAADRVHVPAAIVTFVSVSMDQERQRICILLSENSVQ